MSRNSFVGPLFDSFLLLPGEALDPDRRYAKAMGLLACLMGAGLETLLALGAFVLEQPALSAAHGLLALVALAALPLIRWQFHPLAGVVALTATAWTSSTLGLAFGVAGSTVLWHVALPLGAVLLMGPRAGFVVLVLDLGLAVAHGLWFLPAFHIFQGRAVSAVVLLVGTELASIFAYLLTSLALEMTRRTLADHLDDKDKALDLLSQTKDSENRWADQAQFLEALMDVIPFPLYHKGPDATYVRANASFRVVFDAPEVAGRRAEAVLSPENARTLAKVELDLLARDAMAVEETTLIHADGTPHNFIAYLTPFVDAAQRPQGHIGVFIDITERKLREEKLLQLNATKDQLFSIISHDLRGPVGKLKQLLDIYIDDPGIFDKATWEQVFHDMRRSSDSLFQLLENLLSWARAQQSEAPVKYESIPLEPLVSDVFAVLKLLATDKRVTLEAQIELAGPLLSDRHALSTILRNLVHNALKFSTPGGRITVSAQETVDETWIEVRDTGIGMAEDTIRRILERKERVTTFGTAKEKGQGIGLGLCLDLAQHLGAELTIESTLGQGTAIRLHLPTTEL